jgi:hypothetical protein
MSKSLSGAAKRVMPRRFARWYRRRRALRKYLRALSFEVYERQIRIDPAELEGRIAARRDGFYERLVKEVLERTDLILQELDRRIEGVSARQGTELRRLRSEVAELRQAVEGLGAVGAAAPTDDRPAPARASVD